MIEDQNCVFCKIVKGQLPANVIYEDADFLAFLDIRPLSPGHTIVIPKNHYRWVWDVPNTGKYFGVVTKIARAQSLAFEQELIQSKIIGEEVHHAHIWIFPSPSSTDGDKNDFKNNRDRIKANIKA